MRLEVSRTLRAGRNTASPAMGGEAGAPASRWAQSAGRAVRDRNAVFLIAVFTTYNLLFWPGWVLVFGQPTGAIFYAAFGAFLFLLRVGWPILDRLLPRT